MVKISGYDKPKRTMSLPPRRGRPTPYDAETLLRFLHLLGKETEPDWTGDEVGQRLRRDVDKKIDFEAGIVREVSRRLDDADADAAAKRGPAAFLNHCLERYGTEDFADMDMVKIPSGDPITLTGDVMAEIQSHHADELRIANEHDARLFRVEDRAINFLNGGKVKAFTVDRDKGEKKFIKSDYWLSRDCEKTIRNGVKTDRSLGERPKERTVYVMSPEKVLGTAPANDGELGNQPDGARQPRPVVGHKPILVPSDSEAVAGLKNAVMAERRKRQEEQEKRHALESRVAELERALEAEKQNNPNRNVGGRPPKYDWQGCLAHLVLVANHPDGLPSSQAAVANMAADWFAKHREMEAPNTEYIAQKLREWGIPGTADDGETLNR